MKATLLKRSDIAENIYSFDFSTPEPINHIPGQYVNLTLPHENMDSRGKERWFSVSSAPGPNSFQITTKFVPEASSSFKKALMNLKPGDSLSVSSSMGDFVLPIDRNRELLFVAAGIGITPFLSMLKTLKHRPENRQITLFYAANKRSELVNIDSLKDSLKELDYFIDQEGRRLSAKLLLDKARTMKSPMIYLAGPEQMTESFRDQLMELGFKREDIVGDYFDGY